MTLEIKLVDNPRSWKKISAKANRSKHLFPRETLDYADIATRWSDDHHVVIGMLTDKKQATTGFIQLNRRFVDRVHGVPKAPK